MNSVLSNIQESYRGFPAQLQQSKKPVQRIFSDTHSDKDLARVASIVLKVLGTLSLYLTGSTAYILFYGSISISQLVSVGMCFIFAHECLKIGDNMYKNLVQNPPSEVDVVIDGFVEIGSERVQEIKKIKEESGYFAAVKHAFSPQGGLAAIREGEVEARGWSKELLEGTICVKFFVDQLISLIGQDQNRN